MEFTSNPSRLQVQRAFPEEIILDIVSRLPIKSIGRCRCVSKPWNSLLSHPDFIKTHLNKAKQIPSSEASLLLASLHSYALYTTSLQSTKHTSNDVIATSPTKLNFCYDTFPHNKSLKMVSCDGLILITVYYTGDKGKLHLMNPTTHEFRTLPYLRPSANPLHKVIYGLGYDSVSGDYKIVAVSYLSFRRYPHDDDNLDYSKVTFVDVYSIKNGTWKRLDTSPYYHSEVDEIVVVNGFVHWKACTDNRCVLLALALGEDKVSEVPIPSCFDRCEYKLADYSLHLVEVGGCLGLYSDAWNLKSNEDPWNSKNSAVVWIMKEYGVRESWAKFTIAKGSPSEPIWSLLEPVCVLGSDQLVLLQHNKQSVSGGVNKLVLHNLEERTFKDIILPEMTVEYKVGASFIQTLVSPYKNT